MFLDLDVRDVLPLIQAPTLIMHRRYDLAVNVRAGRYLAEHIPGSRYIELEGTDHAPWAGPDSDQALDEIEEFLTGVRPAPKTERVLATVMFTDIVDSTSLATELGDSRWRDVLEQHQDLVRRNLERFGGREVKTTGDGFLATFDGPTRAVECAEAIVSEAPSLGIEVRAGMHTGEVELMGEDVGGIAVHVAARIAALAEGRSALVSRTVRDLVIGSGIEFDPCGRHSLKGVADSGRSTRSSRRRSPRPRRPERRGGAWLGHREQAQEARRLTPAAVDFAAPQSSAASSSTWPVVRRRGPRARLDRDHGCGGDAAGDVDLTGIDRHREAIAVDSQLVDGAQVGGAIGIEERAQGEDDRVDADPGAGGRRGAGAPGPEPSNHRLEVGPPLGQLVTHEPAGGASLRRRMTPAASSSRRRSESMLGLAPGSPCQDFREALRAQQELADDREAPTAPRRRRGRRRMGVHRGRSESWPSAGFYSDWYKVSTG